MAKASRDAGYFPSELKKLRWINLLGASKYLVVLFDEGGRPLWGASRRTHKYALALESLCHHSVFDFFSIPRADDLNRTYGKEVKKNPALANPLSKVPFEWLRLGDYPTFPSKSDFDLKIISFTFEEGSLFNLHLLRVNPRRFLGVVSFPDTTYPLMFLENKISAVTGGESGKIIGFNGLFHSAFGFQGRGDPLQKHLRELVEFSPPLPAEAQPAARPAGTAEIEWQWAQGFPPFRPTGNEGTVERASAGWRFINRSRDVNAFFVLQDALASDTQDFTLRLSYSSARLPLPNLIWRGLPPGPGVPPDTVGYSLTFRGNYDVVFKRSGETVRSFSWPAPPAAGGHEILLQKTGSLYTLEWDRRRVGVYADYVPFAEPGKNLVLLFLRPGEVMTLKTLELWTGPAEGPLLLRPGNPPLTAVTRGPGPQKSFHVSAKDLILAGRNATLFQFEDVTPLRRDLTEVKRDRDRLAALLGGNAELWGASPPMAELRSKLDAAARSPLSVLIEGETGTGKDVLARLIHEKSGRAPFVKIDCAAIPSELMESELFGHEKGAFTGAVSSQTGKFELARGGTVFLDEISSLPMNLQAKLLNVLQDSQVFRVGGLTPIRLDVRIISATNVSLSRLIAEGRFREDLYYRLNQVKFALPPLRERGEDLALLARHFLDEANRLYGKAIPDFTPEALQRLARASWRGNIRELRSAVLKAALFCGTGRLEAGQFEVEPETPSAAAPGRKKRTDPAVFKSLLEKHGGNVTQACREAGISRFTAYYLLKKHGIGLEAFRRAQTP